MNKRILALLFAAVMLIGLLAACQTEEEISTPEDNSTAVTTTTASSQETDPTTGDGTDETTVGDETGETTTAPAAPSDPQNTTSSHGRPSTTLPIVTLNTTTQYTTKAGATLAKDKIVDLDGHVMTYSTPWRFQETISISDLGDILWHEAMNRAMEDYNCQITVKNIYASPETVKTYIMANKNLSDIICMLYGSMYLPSLGADYLQSWEDIDGSPINLADARWRVSQAGISAFNGKLYGLYFDFTPNVPEIRHVVFANKTLLGQYGINVNDIYAAVDSKQWDWDMMRDIAIKTTKDLDSDGKNDTWGIIGQYSFMFYDFIWSNGGGIITIGKDGSVTATMDSANNIEAVSYLDKLINSDKVVYFPDGFYSEETWSASGSYDCMPEFLTGKYAFAFHEAWNLSQKLRPEKTGADFEYIMLPIPMGPKGTDYIMPADNCATDVMLRTNSADRATKAAIIYNAWARPVDDDLDYSDEYGEELFQSSDKKSMAIYQMLGNKYFLDYGSGVPALTASFNHALVSSLLWHIQSPVAAIESLSGSHSAEISAIYSGAAKN